MELKQCLLVGQGSCTVDPDSAILAVVRIYMVSGDFGALVFKFKESFSLP